MKLGKLMYFASEQINKNKGLYAVFIIMIFAGVFIMNYALAIVFSYSYNIQFMDNLRTEDLYFVSAFFKQDLNAESEDDVKHLTEKTKEYYTNLNSVPGINAESVSETALKIGEYSLHTIIYGEILCQSSVFTLADGRQLFEYDGENIPIMIGDKSPLLGKYSVGDVVQAEASYWENTEDGNREYIKLTLNVEICGVLSAPYKHIDWSGRSSPQLFSDILSSDYAISARNYSNIINTVIIRDTILDNGQKLSDLFWNYTPGIMYAVKISGDASVRDAAESYIYNNYDTVSFSELAVKNAEDIKEGTSDNLFIAVAVMILSALGIGSVSLYMGDKLMKEYSIYFSCGAKWGECIFIEAIRSICVILLPGILSTVVFMTIISMKLGKYCLIPAYDIRASGCILAAMFFIFIISSALFLIKLRRTEPITYIRMMNKE